MNEGVKTLGENEKTKGNQSPESTVPKKTQGKKSNEELKTVPGKRTVHKDFTNMLSKTELDNKVGEAH